MAKAIGLVTMAIVLIIFAFCIPLINIWALNTLFPVLAIPYEFNTWLAMFCLSVFLLSGIRSSKSKD